MIACFSVPAIGLAFERERRPELKGQPLALTRDGMLCVVSHEAERFGIKPGQKASGAYSLCENLTVAPYLLDAYEAAIRPMWNLCAIESSVVEPVSPETCLVELSGRDQELRVRLLLAEIDSRIPATVYCGFADSKFVAIEAARASCKPPHRSVPSGQAPAQSTAVRFVLVPLGMEAAFLNTVTIPASMIEPKAIERLEKLGIRTLGDIRRLPHGELERQIKQQAVRLRRLAVGEHREPVRALWPPRTLEHRIDFEDEVTDTGRIEQAAHRCSMRLANSLGSGYARTVRLIAYLQDRSRRSVAERLASPIHAADDLHAVCLRLLGRLSLAAPVSGLHLIVGDLSFGSAKQLQLLDQNQNLPGLPHERRESLETTQRFLTARYGEHALTLASAAIHHRQIDLSLTALGRRFNEPVDVSIEYDAPVCFSFRNRSHSILRVLDRWKLTECSGDTIAERSSFRVLYDRSSIADLERSASGWRLVGVSD